MQLFFARNGRRFGRVKVVREGGVVNISVKYGGLRFFFMATRALAFHRAVFCGGSGGYLYPVPPVVTERRGVIPLFFFAAVFAYAQRVALVGCRSALSSYRNYVVVLFRQNFFVFKSANGANPFRLAAFLARGGDCFSPLTVVSVGGFF